MRDRVQGRNLFSKINIQDTIANMGEGLQNKTEQPSTRFSETIEDRVRRLKEAADYLHGLSLDTTYNIKDLLGAVEQLREVHQSIPTEKLLTQGIFFENLLLLSKLSSLLDDFFGVGKEDTEIKRNILRGKLAELHGDKVAQENVGRHIMQSLNEVSKDSLQALRDGFIQNLNPKILSELDSAKKTEIFKSLNILFEKNPYSKENERQDIYAALENYGTENKQFFEGYLEKPILDGATKTEEVAAFATLLKSNFNRALAYYIERHLQFEKIDDVMKKVQNMPFRSLLEMVLKTYGVDGKDAITAWSKSYMLNKFNTGPRLRDNLKRMNEIEEKFPGASALLYREFGIRNFERYDRETLISQCNEFDDNKKRYGIVLFSTSDWNGSIRDTSDLITSSLRDQLSGRFNLRVLEASSRMEIVRHLIKNSRRYGQIAFAFIVGHGAENKIIFGGTAERYSLRVADLTGSGAQKTRKFFEDNPTLILASCNAGTRGGIAQKLSSVLNATVIAPPTSPFIPTNVESIHLNISDENDITFQIRFGVSNKFALRGKDERNYNNQVIYKKGGLSS